MSKPSPKETDLYAPVKAMLEARGYEVKAEIEDCDVVAVKPEAPTVIVELKLGFTLDLVLQGINRQNLTDDVYIAVPAPDTRAKRRNWWARQKGYIKLCRMLGLGLLLVTAKRVDVLLDPAPYAPRKNSGRRTRLMAEFTSRAGDPNTGGTTRTKIVTAYRQDALRLAVALNEQSEMKVSDLRDQTGIAKTASILQKDHYDWFARTARGVYALTDAGVEALEVYADILPSLRDEGAQTDQEA